MKVNKKRLDLALTRNCMTMKDLQEYLSYYAIKKIARGGEVKPVTVGLIAQALHVDPELLIGGDEEATNDA